METDLGLDAIDRRRYELMSSLLKRTCLSEESAMTGRPNVESVPLGAKLPMIPGSNLVLHTTNLCKTLHVPFCYFDRTFSSDGYLGGEYNCLHDPHLKRFFESRSDITEKLCSENYITPDQKVVCSLKEYNLYRQYLKHLSVQYLNTKYAEQCKKEVAKKNQESILRMKEKYKAANSRIRQKVQKVKDARGMIEKEIENKRNEVVRQMQEYTEKREKEKKDEKLRKTLLVKKREKMREQRLKDRAVKEYQEMIFRQKLHVLKHAQDTERRKSFEEKLQFERKCKEMALMDNYERKKVYHEMYMGKLKKAVAEEDNRRRLRIAEWESFFAKKQKDTLDAIEAMKIKEKRVKEEERKRFEERLKRKGWTGSACRSKTIFGARARRIDRKSDRGMLKVVRQLSSLGFHNVTLPTGILEAIHSLEKDDPFGDDGKVEDRLKGDRSPRKLKKRDLQSFADKMVTKIIDVSKTVLLPMLEFYESKTGVKVSSVGIPSTLKELSSGVFAEEEDCLPQVLSIHDGQEVTAYAGSKKSNVRFRVSNTELPLDFGSVKNRPPTPKKVRFSSSSSSDMNLPYMTSDSRMVLEETVRKLSEKVVQEIFAKTNLVDPEMQREEMKERVNNVAKSIIDEIVVFGLETACSDRAPSTTPSEEGSTELSTSVEEKISKLASHLIVDVVPGMAPQQSGSSTSTASQISVESNISVLALRVVKSILATVDRKSGKTIGQHLAMRKDLEEQITNLSTKVVEDVAKARHRFSPDEMDSNEFIDLEEKISKLALNIITTVHEGNRPASAASFHSMSYTGVEERVLNLAARIIGGLISLKESLAQDETSGNLLVRPANSVERLLREIFDVETLADSREEALQRVVHSDVRKMSYDIARRFVLDRDGGSSVESGLTDLAAAMEKNKSNKRAARHEKSSGSGREMSTRLEKRSTTSGETRISSALSEIAELVSNNAIRKEEDSVQSIVSSGASNLASQVASGAIVKAVMGQSSSKSSAMNSGISKLADSAVKNVLHDTAGIDSNTRSAIASEIKVLAEKIMWQAVEMAVVDPDSLDSTTRSAISTGASTLATQVASMISGNNSGSSSAMDTLESILSSAVSDMVADMLTQRVLVHAKDQNVKIEEDQLSSEVEKLVRTLLGMKNSESNKMTSTEYPSTAKDETTVTSSISATSSLALDVVKTYLTRNSSKDKVSDQDSSSAISEVASKYVYEVLGIIPPVKQRHNRRSHRNEESFELSSSTENSTSGNDLQKRSSRTTKHDSNNHLVVGKDSSEAKRKRSSLYNTSFMDWRNSPAGAILDHVRRSYNALHGEDGVLLKGQSSSALPGENPDEFNNVMDSLAKRIVSSIVTNSSIEGEARVDRGMMDSPSVEELVGDLALGVVTSLLGLDILSNATSSDSESDDTSLTGAETESSENSLRGKTVPGPSTGQTEQLPPVTDKSIDVNVPMFRRQCPDQSLRKPTSSLLSLFSASTTNEDGYKTPTRSICDDNAQEHPFRVRSPIGREVKVTPKQTKKKITVTDFDCGKSNHGGFSKSRRRKTLPEKIQLPSYLDNPLKQSSGFLDRRRLRNTSEIQKGKEKLPPIERKKLSPRSTDKASKSNLRDIFLWQR